MGKDILRDICFIIGLMLTLSSLEEFTGAFAGATDLSVDLRFLIGILFIATALFLDKPPRGKTLEAALHELEEEHHWRKYEFNRPFMMAEDVEKGYLKRKKQELHLTPIQERIERSVTGGKAIKRPYQEHTYAEHHERESQGGRIIDVDSHITHHGRYSGRFTEKIKRWQNRGKLEHFNKPANGWYAWVVGENGDFVVGDRSTSESVKYGHKLPHPALANERMVYGAGEVLIKDWLIKEYNSGTGHYFDRRNPRGFDKQSKEVFECFRKKAGWKKARGGARYSREHDVDADSVNY